MRPHSIAKGLFDKKCIRGHSDSHFFRFLGLTGRLLVRIFADVSELWLYQLFPLVSCFCKSAKFPVRRWLLHFSPEIFNFFKSIIFIIITLLVS